MMRGIKEFLAHKALQGFYFCLFTYADKPTDQQLPSLEADKAFSIHIRILNQDKNQGPDEQTPRTSYTKQAREDCPREKHSAV